MNSRRTFLSSVLGLFSSLPFIGSYFPRKKGEFHVLVEEISSNRYTAKIRYGKKAAIITSPEFSWSQPEESWADFAKFAFMFQIQRTMYQMALPELHLIKPGLTRINNEWAADNVMQFEPVEYPKELLEEWDKANEAALRTQFNSREWQRSNNREMLKRCGLPHDPNANYDLFLK